LEIFCGVDVASSKIPIAVFHLTQQMKEIPEMIWTRDEKGYTWDLHLRPDIDAGIKVGSEIPPLLREANSSFNKNMRVVQFYRMFRM
jgi:hypothetical protein